MDSSYEDYYEGNSSSYNESLFYHWNGGNYSLDNEEYPNYEKYIVTAIMALIFVVGVIGELVYS